MRSLNEYHLNVAMANISAASSVYIAVPDAGSITDVYLCEGAAITVASNVVTVTANGGSTLGTLTCTVTGSGAGTVISTTCTSNTVNKGDYITVTSAGGATGSQPAVITIVIKR